MTTPLVRADTTINTNVKGSKVFALAFVKAAGVTDAFTESDIRGFVMPKLGDATLLGSAIVQLDSVSSGKDFHSGRGDEAFTGLLTKVFNNINNGGGGLSGATVTENPSDLADGINVYFMTMDGLNETAVRSINSVSAPKAKYWRMAFLATGSTESDPTTSWHATDFTSVGNDASGNGIGFPWEAPYTGSHGWYTNSNEFLMRTTLTESITSRPVPIDASKIASVVINKGQDHTFNVFSNAKDVYISLHFMESEGLNSDLLTVNAQYYQRAAMFDVEFVNEETIMEFIWNGYSERATLPYLIKIDYSQDGVTYENDVIYMRDSTQTQYPVLAEFANPTDHMVLQRVDGVNWSDAVSMTLA